jgi:RNA polymerase sigma-70 factor (ECF subfamily)
MNDGDAIGRVLAGDPDAFAHLVDRYYDHCLRYATGMLGNRQDGEEAVQDAFVRAFRSLGRYEDRGRFDAWLFRIVVNRCRTRGAAALRNPEFAGTEQIESTVASRRDADPLTREVVREAVAALPSDQREAFLLKYVEGFDYSEIADMTGAGVSALKMRVSRARALLRSMLTDGEEFNHDEG